MNCWMILVVCCFKDSDGNYFWQFGFSEVGSFILLGYLVSEVEDMFDIGSDSFLIVFGDFCKGYLVLD